MVTFVHLYLNIAQARMAQHSSEKEKAKRRLEAHQGKLKEVNDSIAEKEAQVVEIRKNAEVAEQAASQNCPRIETKRKSKEIESEIKKLKNFIEKQQPRIEEQESIRQQYSDAMGRYMETMSKIREQKKALKVCVGATVCEVRYLGTFHIL